MKVALSGPPPPLIKTCSVCQGLPASRLRDGSLITGRGCYKTGGGGGGEASFTATERAAEKSFAGEGVQKVLR